MFKFKNYYLLKIIINYFYLFFGSNPQLIIFFSIVPKINYFFFKKIKPELINGANKRS